MSTIFSSEGDRIRIQQLRFKFHLELHECAIHPKGQSQNAEVYYCFLCLHCCLVLYCCTIFTLGMGHYPGSQHNFASHSKKNGHQTTAAKCKSFRSASSFKSRMFAATSSFLYLHWRGWTKTKDEEYPSQRVLEKKQCENVRTMLPGHKVTRSVKWPICLLSRGTVLRKRHSSHRRKHNTAALTLVGQIWCLCQCGDIQKSTSMLEQYEHQGSLWKEVQQSKALTQLYAQTWNAELLAGIPLPIQS